MVSKSVPCTLVITRPEMTAPLRDTLQNDRSVMIVDSADAGRALRLIAERTADLVALDSAFLDTSHGRDFLSRVRDLRSESNVELRAFSPLQVRKSPRGSARAVIAAASQPLAIGVGRRVPRYQIEDGVATIVKGAPSALVDLSVLGAQVISDGVLRPNERVAMRILEEGGDIQMRAAIAWSMFERSVATRLPQYRAGLEFTAADAETLERYCRHHSRSR